MVRKQLEDERVWALAFGLVLVTMPAVTLILAFAVLSATQSAIVEQLTLVELAELYLVELLAFAVFSYLLYRLARFSRARHDALTGNSAPADAEGARGAESAEQEGSS